MGYRISSLNNLPSNLECYYFLIGDYSFDSTVNNLFRNSFRSLADALGENIAIIEKTNNGKLERDLLNTLYTNPNLMETIEKWERNTPGLLIMWCHPSDLTDNESLVYIPFLTLADVYDTNVNALFEAPIPPLAINEIPAPVTFGVFPSASLLAFNIEYAVCPFVAESASSTTLPSASILSTFISLSILAKLIKDFSGEV